MSKRMDTPLPVKVQCSLLQEICLPVIQRTKKLQSLLILVLIAVSLSATFHTDANGNFSSVIQKPLPSFTQVSQKKVWHQGDLSDTPAKTDYRMESTEGFDQYQEAPPGIEMPKFMMHLRRLLILRPMTDLSNK